MSRKNNDEDDDDIYTVTVVNPTTPPRQKRKVVEALPFRTPNPLPTPSAADLVRSLKF